MGGVLESQTDIDRLYAEMSVYFPQWREAMDLKKNGCLFVGRDIWEKMGKKSGLNFWTFPIILDDTLLSERWEFRYA